MRIIRKKEINMGGGRVGGNPKPIYTKKAAVNFFFWTLSLGSISSQIGVVGLEAASLWRHKSQPSYI